MTEQPIGSAPAAGTTVSVKGIALTTTQAQLHDFFSFCGAIQSLHLERDGEKFQSATVTFVKASAASTAVMLHGSPLDGALLDVQLEGGSGRSEPAPASHEDEPVGQEDKPKTAIVAEYLAHGYKISDDITKKAIELDNKHGLSLKFKKYLSSLDRSLGEKLERTSAPAAAAAAAAPSDKEKPAAEEKVSDTTETAAATSAQAPAAEAAATAKQQPSLARHVQERVDAVLERPEVKKRSHFVWSKLSEYYNAIANHPRIHAFYTDASKTVTDVHEEAKRIAAEKKAGGTGGAAGTSVPVRQMSASWVLVALLLFSSLTLQGTNAHLHGEEPEVADIAGVKAHEKGHESYIQRHMASEHHIGAFDMGSFFALHDLNRDGVWDRAEQEAIYGVHHSTSVKHSENYEVHDEKANHIIKVLGERLDKNGDGVITKAEFIAGGPDGLPLFEEYGKGVLGHHYDEESEYFVHHEEIYHSTPETQTDESYTHKEDLEHFAKHDKIEAEEERRERKAEGMPTIEEDERRKKEAEAKGEKYVSPYDLQLSQEEQKKAELEHQKAEAGNAIFEAETNQHIFRTPDGQHVVHEQSIKWQEEEKPGGKRQQAAAAKGAPSPKAGSAAADRLPQGVVDRIPGETDEGRRQRLARAKLEAAKRPSYGEGNAGFAKPRDDADRMRKGAPYKYRVKKQSYFLCNSAA
ncbi:hypothetical protein IE53DRAFT_404967 [Violaceomyces palustris]|uniref:Uncharacterized protein n=1 Tax=Violaceomyces palustris TaxID=1673888 RepID=A0ACD0P401_9BASI|nr:hypothetical protein IE53DRAFT_404967 [Violaceomyces palustris]